MSETERVTMIWPKELKDQVREKAGKRGITEFVMEAAQVHLGVADDLSGASKELNEVKYFAQQLADQLALGGSAEERLSALMEIEFPSWIDTSGWPPAYAERVRPEYLEPDPVVPEPQVEAEVVQVAEPVEVAAPVEKVAVEEPVVEATEDVQPVDLPHDRQSPVAPRSGDDLLAKIRAKAMEKGVDIDGLGLKPASQVPQPEPVVQKDLCPNCSEELVDGECWTCG